MRKWLLLGAFAAFCSGCAGETETPAPPVDDSATIDEAGAVDPATDPATLERWCNSYKIQQVCPTNVCHWFSTPAPGHCGLPKDI